MNTDDLPMWDAWVLSVLASVAVMALVALLVRIFLRRRGLVPTAAEEREAEQWRELARMAVAILDPDLRPDPEVPAERLPVAMLMWRVLRQAERERMWLRESREREAQQIAEAQAWAREAAGLPPKMALTVGDVAPYLPRLQAEYRTGRAEDVRQALAAVRPAVMECDGCGAVMDAAHDCGERRWA